MSTVVVWRNSENENSPTIWAVADTRYSRPGTNQSGRFITTDYGPKLFEIDVIVAASSSSGMFDQIVHYQKIGLGFAGAALAALCIYSSVSRMLSNLASPFGDLPSMEDMHFAVSEIARSYTTPIGNQNAIAFCSVGHCFKSGRDEVFLTEIPHSGSEQTRRVILEQEKLLLLGSHQQEIRQMIQEKDAEPPKFPGTIKIQRSPLRVLRHIVGEGTFSDIGGGVDLGILSGGSFRLRSNMKPIDPDESGRNVTLESMGHDLLGPIGKVGPCIVNIPGMA